MFLIDAADSPQVVDPDHSVQPDDIGGLGADTENWQALTQKEEEDVETLMTKCEFAISNAEAFTEELTNQLSMLDGVSEVP